MSTLNVKTRTIAYTEDEVRNLLPCVDPARRKKVERLKNPAVAALSLGAGLLLAEAVNEVCGLTPDEIRVMEDEAGKPYIEGCPGFFYNLTHTKDFTAIAYGDVSCGIDAEQIRFREGDARVLTRCFTEEERAYVLGGTGVYDASCAERFFRIWTMKESMVKHSGEGIRKRLSAYGVDPECMCSADGRLLFTELKKDDFILMICAEKDAKTIA